MKPQITANAITNFRELIEQLVQRQVEEELARRRLCRNLDADPMRALKPRKRQK